MTMKPQKPLPKAQTQIQVDLKDAETMNPYRTATNPIRIERI